MGHFQALFKGLSIYIYQICICKTKRFKRLCQPTIFFGLLWYTSFLSAICLFIHPSLSFLYSACNPQCFQVDLENEKKKIRKVFQDNKDNIQDLQRCLEFIVEGMNQLAQNPSASLSKVKVDPVKLNMVYHLGGGVCPRAIEANVKASGIMEGLAIGLDMFFKDGKGATKNKLRSKCAAKLRVLVQEMGTGLREFERAKESLKVFLP